MRPGDGRTPGDGGARCAEARRDVHRLLDERLTPARRRTLLRHVKACRGCFSVLEFARIMRGLIRAHVCTCGCPKALERRVRKAVRAA